MIHRARIVSGDNVIEDGWLAVSGGIVTELGDGTPPESLFAGGADVVDADGQWLVPGFVDVHVHGADGAEVMDGTAEAIARIGRFHAKHGTTGWLPTTVVGPAAALQRALLAVAEVRDTPAAAEGGAAILGVHLEGPMISAKRIGAQNPAHRIDPDVPTMTQLLDTVPDLVRKVTIAPELAGADEVIRLLLTRNAIVSMGHTDASFSQAMHAIQQGASHATHLFNAMRGLHHRDGGTVGASLLSDNVVCEIIADGHHVDFDMLKLAYRLKGRDRLMLITDAIAAAGRPDGAYKLGGLDVTVKAGICLLQDGQTLAGSTLTMDAAVRNMANRVGVSLPDAVAMASAVPARELGLASRKGRIAVGYDADLVLLDESLQVKRTWISGKRLSLIHI